jgi:hypothetical protein
MSDEPLDPSFWSTFFRVPTLLVNGVPLPLRNIINFTTDLSPDSPTVEDNPIDQRTEVPLTGFIGTVPGGAVGAMQYHGVDGSTPIFKGTPKLVIVDTDGNVEHSGTPVHKETYAQFRDGSANAYAQSQWKVGTTSNATPTVICSIAIPSGIGDCFISVQAKTTYYYASSGVKGGSFSGEATFTRASGTLTRVGIADLSPPGLAAGTAAGGIDIVANGSNDIDVKGTGLGSTNITWLTSLHIQVVAP